MCFAANDIVLMHVKQIMTTLCGEKSQIVSLSCQRVFKYENNLVIEW